MEGYGCEGDIQSTALVTFGVRCEGDLSTRGGDLRVLFQPTCAGDFGELRVHFGGGEMRG